MILKSHLNSPHPNPLDNCSCIAYMDRYLLLGNCSLRRLKRLLLVLSIAVPDAILPPPSLGSYLLRPCSRRQLLLHCSTTRHPWRYAISALTSKEGGNAARLNGTITVTTSLWIM